MNEQLNATRVPEQAKPTKPRTETKWDALTRASLRPITIYCKAYPLVRNMAWRDESCHTRLPLKAEVLEAHTVGHHSGGFLMCLRHTEGKQSAVWPGLAERDMEAYDFRCAVCDKQITLDPNSFAPHMRPHPGMTKMAYKELAGEHPNATGFFNVTLRKRGVPYNADEARFNDASVDEEF